MTNPPTIKKHPMDLLPKPDGKSQIFEDTNILKNLSMNRNPFFGGSAPNTVKGVHPWMKVLANVGGAYLGLPTVDFNSLIRRPAFTGGMIGSSPAPEFAQAQQQSGGWFTPQSFGGGGTQAAIQALLGGVGSQSMLPPELLGSLPGAMRAFGYDPRYPR